MKKKSIDELAKFQIEHSVDQITWRSSDLRLIVILTLKKKVLISPRTWLKLRR